jgi:putative endonuclease
VPPFPVILSAAKDLLRFLRAAICSSEVVRQHQYCVYIATNGSKTLYTGVTNDLKRRMFEHRNSLIPGFTSKYRIDRLVHFETTSDVRAAIAREKQIKGWKRVRKVALIEAENPRWLDLSKEWD